MVFEKIKQNFGKASISRKLMFWLVFVTLIVMIIFGVINYFLFVNQLDQDLDTRLEEDAQKLEEVLALHVWNLDNNSVDRIIDAQVFVKSLSLLRISDNFGELMYEVDNMEEGKGYTFKKEIIIYEDENVGTVEIASSREHVEVAERVIIRSTAVIILVVFFTVWIVALFVSRSISKPIEDLTKTAEKIASGDLNIKASVTSKDEIGVLGNTFNFMTEALQISYAQLKKQIKKLKELDNLKDNFLNTTSHELKTPLIPIHSQLQLLLAGDFGQLNSEQKKSLEMIFRNEKRLNRLVSDVLDLSRIRTKKLRLIPKKISLAKIIKEVAEEMRPKAQEKKIDINVKLADLPMIVADPSRIAQVVGNLVNNAIKFTPEKGEIEIVAEKKPTKGGSASGGGKVIVKISDTGIGISPKNLKKLFTPFLQLDIGLSRKHGGTGLGLVISKGIVEAHGGKIWAESKGEGRGATFAFTLPIKRSG